MSPVHTWGGAIAQSLLELWGRFMNFLPTLIGALLVFILGMLIASVVGKVVTKLIKSLRVDHVLEHIAFNEKLRRAGIDASPSHIVGELVKWFLVLVFLMAATDIMGLQQVTEFLNSIILYLPNIVVATIILTLAFLLGSVAYTVVRGSTRAAGVMSATLLATLIKWAIMIFGLLAALIQLGIATSLVNTLFIGFVSALSLAIGLAFGLGGRDEAALILKKLREEIVAGHSHGKE
jgi:hypothetical protein